MAPLVKHRSINLPDKTRAYNRGLTVYLILAGLFVSALVTANLIFLKFFDIRLAVFGWEYNFIQSVGLLPYPLTFLVTDVISEVYGRKAAGKVVLAGFFASMLMLLIVGVAIEVPVFAKSPVGQDTFVGVFGLSFIGVGASMAAYLAAQLIDVRIFHFWKRLTKGKHLWLRNNASTWGSQIVDTFLVVFILYSFGEIDDFITIFINGVLFKMAFALIDTPIVYGVLAMLRPYLGLKFAEELDLFAEPAVLEQEVKLQTEIVKN